MDEPAAVVVAVLAAGSARRFGSAKQLARLGGTEMLRIAVDTALRAEVGPVLCVVAAGDNTTSDIVPPGAQIVANPDACGGLSSSLRQAVAAADRRGARSLVIALGDQPLIGVDAYRRVAAHGDEAPIVAATYGGRRGHPVRISRDLWPEIDELRGDVGARVLMDCHAVAEVVCDDTGSPEDVDTPEDLARIDGLLRAAQPPTIPATRRP